MWNRLPSGKKYTGARLLVGLLFFLTGWSLIAWAAANALIVHREFQQADALAILSGSATYNERARRAAELYAAGRAPKILLTNDNQRGGWSSRLQRNPLFVERAVEELLAAGVPADRIEIVGPIQGISGTLDEASVLRAYAATHGLRSVLVVTSAYHSRRAFWTLSQVFRGSGVEIGLEPVSPGQQTPSPATWWLHIHGWQMVAGEYCKLAYYKLRYTAE